MIATTIILYIFVLAFLGTVVGGCCCGSGTNIYDTGQTCCSARLSDFRNCCYSNQSNMTITMPSLTYTGFPNASLQSLIDWYNGNIAGTTVTLTGNCTWFYTSTDGDHTFVIQGGPGSATFSITQTDGSTFDYGSTGTSGDCCGWGGGTWIDTTSTTSTASGAAAGDIHNNNCCQDCAAGFGGSPCDNTIFNCPCLKHPPLCTGCCNPLP